MGLIATATVLAFGLAGFRAADGPDPTASTPVVATPASRLAAAMPAVLTPAPPFPVPEIALHEPLDRWTPDDLPTGTNWTTVAQRILDIRMEAYRRRDVRILGDIFTGRCACMKSDRAVIDRHIRERRYYDGDRFQVTGVRVNQRADRDAVVLEIDAILPPAPYRDEMTGDVLFTTSGHLQSTIQVALLRGNWGLVHDDGRWNVIALQFRNRQPRTPDLAS